MRQAVVHVAGLPAAPLDAAEAFHAEPLAQARQALAEADGLALVFAPAEHGAWRLAAVQALAREAAPKRVNAVAGADEAAIGRALDFLTDASGVTGQILAV